MDWKLIDNAPHDRPVFVGWAGRGPIAVRPAVWQNRRLADGIDLGPGWTCYFTGHHLTALTHYAEIEMPPAPAQNTSDR